MSVVRIYKSKNYTTMSNYHFKEKNMSLKAKGLLSLMLSLPDNWDYSISGLVAICKESETAIKSTLDELKEFGYLEVIKNIPTKENGGRLNYEYIVYEKPIQIDKKQGLENLGLENQDIENQVQLNTNKLNTNNKDTLLYKYNKDIMSSKKVFNNEHIDKLENGEQKKKKEKKKYNVQQILNNKKVNLQDIEDIIIYLNQKTNKQYKVTTKTTQNLIINWLKQDFTVDQFKKVIDKKVKEWQGTEMEQYLRPSTLFGDKFEEYYNTPLKMQGKPRISFSSKPTFDNTASHEVKKAVSKMDEDELNEWKSNLATDENGNFKVF